MCVLGFPRLSFLIGKMDLLMEELASTRQATVLLVPVQLMLEASLYLARICNYSNFEEGLFVRTCMMFERISHRIATRERRNYLNKVIERTDHLVSDFRFLKRYNSPPRSRLGEGTVVPVL